MTLHIARLLRIVPYIPRQPHKRSTAEIHDYLAGLGFDVSRRQIERDLLLLQSAFPLANDDEKKRGWFWPREAELPFSGLGIDTHSALAFRLVEQHLIHALPRASLKKLNRYFSEANQVLGEARGGKTSEWAERVIMLPPGVPLEPPEIDDSVEAAVSLALLDHRVLKVTYRKRSGVEKEYLLSPAGLVVRLGIVYLVADYEGSESLHFFALHRMLSAEITDLAADVASVEVLRRTLSRGAFGFSQGEEGIKVTLRFAPEAGMHLLESRFSLDQESQVLADGRLEIKGTLPNNLESRWWILGFGSGVEVLEPEQFRNEISQALRDALERYHPPAKGTG